MKKITLITLLLIITIIGNAQNCLKVVSPTAFSGPDASGKYTLSISYEVDGNKTLETVVYCGDTQIFTDCFQTSNNGTKIYSGLDCLGGLSKLKAVFTTRTGSCNSAQCGATQSIGGGGVLATTFKNVTATKLYNNTYKMDFDVPNEMNIDHYIIKISENGINWKQKTIIFVNPNFSKGSYSVIIKL